MDEVGITSKALAAKLGIKEPTVRYWLRAETFPDIETLAALGKALGLDDYRKVLPPLR
jgi:transcriptional regulator with XRE-family HTH domain